jgi:hypothetical protein
LSIQNNFVPLHHNKQIKGDMERDKKVFLLDKQHYRKEQVENLTEKDLEEWVAEEDYTENYTIIKIDANGYSTPSEAMAEEGGGLFTTEDYYVLSFGF